MTVLTQHTKVYLSFTGTWDITTTTSPTDGSGTDDDVYLKILGHRATADFVKIYDRLQKGKTQCFSFDNIRDVGNVHSLFVETRGSDNWCFTKITLRKRQTNIKYIFDSSNCIRGESVTLGMLLNKYFCQMNIMNRQADVFIYYVTIAKRSIRFIDM